MSGIPNAAALGAHLYEQEDDFGEKVSTFGTRLQTKNPVDLTQLIQDKLPLSPTRQLPHEGTKDVLGVYGGQFPVSLDFTGHGQTAAGALTKTDLAALMEIVIGGIDVSGVGTTVATGSWTTTSFDVADASGLAKGMLIRVGKIGDDRGNGQFYAIASKSGNSITLATATLAPPQDGDVVYASQLVYPEERISASGTPGFEDVVSTRWQLLTANMQVEAHGCFPMSYSFAQLNPGESPVFNTNFGVARWAPPESAAEFPSSVATDAKTPTPNAGGSLFLNKKGSSARLGEKLHLRAFDLTTPIQCVPLRSPCGTDSRQVISGARRIPGEVNGGAGAAGFTITLDRGAIDIDTLYADNDPFHVLYTLSAVDGEAVALYFPNCRLTSPRPTQRDVDQLNRMVLTFRAEADPDGTDDLTRAAMLIGMA